MPYRQKKAFFFKIVEIEIELMNHTVLNELPRIDLADLYKSKHEEFVSLGYTILNEDELPLTEDEWQAIEKRHAELAYKEAVVTETGEDISNVIYFRIKMSRKPEIHCETIWNALNTDELYDVYKAVSGMNNPYMDRCQAHVYMKNGFLARHSDIELYPEYGCALIMFLSDNYEGGEFVVYKSEENPAILKPKKRSLLLTNPIYEHSVNLIESGERKNICFFFSEGKLY